MTGRRCCCILERSRAAASPPGRTAARPQSAATAPAPGSKTCAVEVIERVHDTRLRSAECTKVIKHVAPLLPFLQCSAPRAVGKTWPGEELVQACPAPYFCTPLPSVSPASSFGAVQPTETPWSSKTPGTALQRPAGQAADGARRLLDLEPAGCQGPGSAAPTSGPSAAGSSSQASSTSTTCTQGCRALGGSKGALQRSSMLTVLRALQ